MYNVFSSKLTKLYHHRLVRDIIPRLEHTVSSTEPIKDGFTVQSVVQTNGSYCFQRHLKSFRYSERKDLFIIPYMMGFKALEV